MQAKQRSSTGISICSPHQFDEPGSHETLVELKQMPDIVQKCSNTNWVVWERSNLASAHATKSGNRKLFRCCQHFDNTHVHVERGGGNGRDAMCWRQTKTYTIQFSRFSFIFTPKRVHGCPFAERESTRRRRCRVPPHDR